MTPLAPEDLATWWTVRINDLIDAGRFAEAPQVSTIFPPSLGPGERVVAEGAYSLRDHSAPGDGTYEPDRSIFFAPGTLGLAVTAGHAVSRAILNTNRRNAAREDAVPRWREIETGQVYVSDWGLYLRSLAALRPLPWTAVTSMQLVGRGHVLLTGDTGQGPVHWILSSVWAELAFTLWARARHPQHPQLLSGAWVPPGWAERVAQSDIAPPPSLSGRWTPLMLPPGNG